MDRTEFMAQRDGERLQSGEDIQEFIGETLKAHPLSEGATWLMCDEESEQFVWQTKEEG